MTTDEKQIITSQLKSFTRFVLDLDVESYLKENPENEVLKVIAEATLRYKEDLNKQIHNTVIKLGMSEVIHILFILDLDQVETSIEVSQKLVNEYVKEQFGGINGHD